ncbi:MAG: efflux RND transporter periplasmic adaptor subunit [Gammaproteobacteria bacterium]|nr:efflux RND transporter periplasmic adaptor subunit [Gammaproteobacteria bacterium]
MTSLQKNIISMILPFALWAFDANSQIVVSSTFPSTQEINEEENLMGLIYSKSSPSLAVEVSGRVVKIIADVGDEVKAGDILAKIDSEKYNLQFSQAKAEIARLSALLVNKELDLQRAEKLFKDNLVSEEMMDRTKADFNALKEQMNAADAQLRNANRLIEETNIKAPIESEVAIKHIDAGDYVQPGMVVYELVDTKNLKVDLSFPEYLSPKLKKGLEVRITSPTNPDEIVISKIKDIKPNIDSRNKSLTTIIDFENPGTWLPGASSRATVVFSKFENAIVVPQISVVRRSIGEVIYVVKGDSVKETPVKTGLRKEGYIQILEGITLNDEIVKDGAGFLADSSIIEIVN